VAESEGRKEVVPSLLPVGRLNVRCLLILIAKFIYVV